MRYKTLNLGFISAFDLFLEVSMSLKRGVQVYHTSMHFGGGRGEARGEVTLIIFMTVFPSEKPID